MLLSYLLSGIIIMGVIALLMMFMGKKAPPKGDGLVDAQAQAQAIKDANRRLQKNPNDPVGLSALGDMYFSKQVWDKAYPLYDQLSKLSASVSSIDGFQASLRCGICAINLDKLQEATVALSVAYKMNPHDFDVNYYMGLALFKAKQYEKAIPCLKKALVLEPEAPGVNLVLGQCYYYGHHYHDSLPCFRNALTEDPGNKEALFDMADAMSQEGHGDKAIKVFMHLRPDPVYGARSCLEAGIYHANMGDYAAAFQDFEIGLKHENIPPEVLVEIEYRYAQCFFSANQFARGLALLSKIREVNPNYKDVNALFGRYQELSQNTNLQVYLASGASDFVALCRKFINAMYKNAAIKILDINVNPAYTDVQAEVNSTKWQDTELFRFFRTSGATGELYVRDFHGHMHDVKADRGYCITAGIFSEDAHKFIEGRPIDLVEKSQLTRVLKMIQM